MKLIDSHVHLESEEYDADLDAVVIRAREAGITQWICVANGLKSYLKACHIVEKYPESYISLGIHPHDADKAEDFEALAEKVKEPKVVALGETGLDYYYDNSPRDLQKSLFEKFLKLSKNADLPLVIHMRQAEEDCLEMIDSVFPNGAKGVMHCFTSSSEYAQKFLDRGFYISFSGIVTFKKTQSIQEVVPLVPFDRLLVETDAPFLAPEPYRGKRNEPAYMVKTAEKVAALRGISLKELATQTTQNAKNLFGFK